MSLREKFISIFMDRYTKRNQTSAKYKKEGYSWGTQFIRRGARGREMGLYIYISNIRISKFKINIFWIYIYIFIFSEK